MGFMIHDLDGRIWWTASCLYVLLCHTSHVYVSFYFGSAGGLRFISCVVIIPYHDFWNLRSHVPEPFERELVPSLIFTMGNFDLTRTP
jgi:hypothetical protein